ncbi:MAG: UDP-2,3-diacylglucosamine diphosphatase [Acidimicrobiia bacterium]|nr:UDP-2,3-diacylglucosamine diphosphatase [Acidimicrobiia bacterium]
MIIDAKAERLFVISDLHLGNPASTARDRILGFLDHVRDCGASLCINGDGFEMLQTSMSRLAADAVPVVQKMQQLREGGGRVHYIVGNHDMVLEHFLEGLLLAKVSPFINLRSGDKRIRIEHGHIYDPFFARHPDLYEAAAWAAGRFLVLSPDTYQLWTRAQKRLEDRRHKRAAGDTQAASHYYEAADMLLQRGFDTVVFGHTHNAEVVELDHGTFVNSGNWLTGSSYVEIDGGEVSLKRWDRRRGVVDLDLVAAESHSMEA